MQIIYLLSIHINLSESFGVLIAGLVEKVEELG